MLANFARKISEKCSQRAKFHTSNQSNDFLGARFDYPFPTKDVVPPIAEFNSKQVQIVEPKFKSFLPHQSLIQYMKSVGNTNWQHYFLSQEPSAIASRNNLYFTGLRKYVLGGMYITSVFYLTNNLYRLYVGGGRRKGFSLN